MNGADNGIKKVGEDSASQDTAVPDSASDTARSLSDQRPASLEHAPAIPSSADIARMTISEKKENDPFAEEGIILEPKRITPVPDPLFAARILEQEKEAALRTGPPVEEQAMTVRATIPETHDGAQRIRTYQSDVAGALKKEKTSLIQMVLAEQEKKRDDKETASPKNPKNLALIIVSVALIVFGLVAAGFVAWHYVQTQQETAARAGALADVPSFIVTESQKGIDVTDLTKDRVARAIAQEITSAKLRLDTVEHVYLLHAVTDTANPSASGSVQTLVHTSEFWNLLESGMPEALLRALSQDFFIGIHAFNGNQPFIILRADYFESAFAGMLRWESTLARDVLPLFGIQTTPDLITKPFADIVIKNRDYRALLDENGNIVLLYLFQDKSTIIIATAEETIREVVDRLNRAPSAIQ